MTKHSPFTRVILLMTIAFVGIFLYGLLAALPGSVLPTLERNQFLPNDSAVGTFLLINAIGAVVAYLVSGPIPPTGGDISNESVTSGNDRICTESE